MEFKSWLLKFKSVDLAIGDLANDVASDNAFPSNIRSKSDLVDYLDRKHASYQAIDVAKDVYDFFEADQKG